MFIDIVDFPFSKGGDLEGFRYSLERCSVVLLGNVMKRSFFMFIRGIMICVSSRCSLTPTLMI